MCIIFITVSHVYICHQIHLNVPNHKGLYTYKWSWHKPLWHETYLKLPEQPGFKVCANRLISWVSSFSLNFIEFTLLRIQCGSYICIYFHILCKEGQLMRLYSTKLQL